ncbi:probable membrane-associated kinase regulator 5 [Punica granatum]|uniref:Uncharacterized protein n=2 Tax=Punica granatum TaxID=22663 RepID=A0A2I0K4L1_PUNGR|nr:probable membrane-associated kinase regulator 5 [Punica granatum]PKI63481.1 hypothetical protein CRG98_016148 [Punica granatum]
MEALSFFKFWKPTVSIISPAIETCPPLDLDNDDDDSFFELELFLPDLNTKNIYPTDKEKKQSSSEPGVAPSPGNLFSRRKVIPIEPQPSSRPQSPISLFKSSPRFRVFMFRKSKAMPNPKTGETEEPVCLGRAKSSLAGAGEVHCNPDGSLLEYCSVSKRFSKDGMQRYLKLAKPFSGKGSERDAAEELRFFSRNLPRASPSQSPVMARKHAGKSKMMAVNGGVSPARNDDSWAQQHDGIQGAILHCKKSFHSSPRDCSLTLSQLSRSAMDPLQRREHSVPATA